MPERMYRFRYPSGQLSRRFASRQRANEILNEDLDRGLVKADQIFYLSLQPIRAGLPWPKGELDELIQLTDEVIVDSARRVLPSMGEMLLSGPELS